MPYMDHRNTLYPARHQVIGGLGDVSGAHVEVQPLSAWKSWPPYFQGRVNHCERERPFFFPLPVDQECVCDSFMSVHLNAPLGVLMKDMAWTFSGPFLTCSHRWLMDLGRAATVFCPNQLFLKLRNVHSTQDHVPHIYLFFFYLIGILHPRIILGDEQFAGYISFYPSILHYWMYFMASRLNFHSCSLPWSLSPQLWSLGCKMQAKQTFIHTVTE